MEPVTHILTGACLARAGLNRRAAYATATMAIAAEFPDIDTLWSIRGPVSSFQHHRGITHTFIGIPFEAALIVGVVWAVHRWRVHHNQTRVPLDLRATRPLTAAPTRWAALYGCTLLALLSHIFLDFTNNYGIRPFFPFDAHWYAASITFIFDPLMFVMLLGALVLPAIFRLVGSEVGARRAPFAPRGWAVVALAGVVALWTLREVEHNRAVILAQAQSVTAPSDGSQPENLTYLQPLRVLANPDPFSPFRWWTVTDFGPLYQRGEATTRSGAFYPAQQTEPKLNATPALLAAEASGLGRAYLDWSPMPYLDVVRQGTEQGAGSDLKPGHTLVTFRDPRFMGEIPPMRSRTPLEGIVELDANNHVVREVMGGKEQQ